MTMQIFVLEGFQWSTIEAYDDDEVIKFQIRCFGAIFEIQYKLHNLSLSPILSEQFRGSLAIMRAYEIGNNHDAEKASEEILRLKEPFVELMTELAPNPLPLCNQLNDYLYPPFLVLEARAAAQESTAIQPYFKGQLPRQIRFPAGQYISTSVDWLNLVRSFSSQQIRLTPSSNPEQHPCLRGPAKVIAEDGAVCYYKDLHQGILSLSRVTKAKPWIHLQITAAIETKKLRSDIRICRLHSVVIDNDREVLQHWYCATEEDLVAKWGGDGSDDWTLQQYADPNFSMKRLVGILVHYIPNKGTLEEIAPWSDCLDENRRRWASELEDLIKELHVAGLVWGDAKPGNVLVDLNDNIWLIDLEGGYTVGWVDEANQNSQVGDLQGVKRIKDWLIRWSEKPVDRIVH